MEGPIDNPIPVSPTGPVSGRPEWVEPPEELFVEPTQTSRHDIVEYDLADWVHEQHRELIEQLRLGRIPHQWRGTVLRVPGAHEEAVDHLIDAIDELPTIDAEVEYEFSDWTPQQQDELITRIHEAGIACLWDGVTLAVAGKDEAAVDALVLAVDPSFPTADVTGAG